MIVEWAVIVWCLKETLDGEKQGGNGVSGAPLVLENVETNVSGHVNVGMENRGVKRDCRCGHRVVGWKPHGEGVLHAGIRRGIGSVDGTLPGEKVVVVGESADTGNGFHHEGHEFGLETLRDLSLGGHCSNVVGLQAKRKGFELRRRREGGRVLYSCET